MNYIMKVSDIAETGDWGADNERGTGLAKAALRLADEQDNPYIVAHMMRDITKSGRHGGIEVGFCAAISEAALNGVRAARP
jgi:hypothetical protein